MPPSNTSNTINVIRAENALHGSSEWKITRPARNHEIEGFASLTSVAPGESISLYLNSNLVARRPLSAKMDVYRLGWYQGQGGRLILSDRVMVNRQPACPTSIDGRYTIECRWSPAHALTIPGDWLSGVYLAKLTLVPPSEAKQGSQRIYESYIIFVVRDDVRASHFVFQTSMATYQAYNAWGGRDTYGEQGLSDQGRCWSYPDLPPEQTDDSPACVACRAYTGRACKAPAVPPLPNRSLAVSFNRPYEHGYGSGDFFLFEYPMLKWLERVGYDVTYISDLDTDRTMKVLLGHKGFLSVGHDEYWSWDKRDHVERARDSGVSLGFFGANAMYWQVRFEPSFNGERRTLVVYKHNASPGVCIQWIPRMPSDPMANIDSSRVTARWRDEPLNRPEQEVVGQMYGDWFDPDRPPWAFNLLVGRTTARPGSGHSDERTSMLFQGTGLRENDQLPGLVGNEFDFTQNSFPGNPEDRSICEPARPARDYPKPAGLQTLADSILIPGYRSGRSCLNPANGTRSDLGCEDRVQLRHSNVTYYTAPSGARVFSAGTFLWSWGLEDADFDFGSGRADRLERHYVSDPRMQRWTANILNSFLGPAMVADFSSDQPIGIIPELEPPGQILYEWFNPYHTLQLVGDFLDLGQDQIVSLDRKQSNAPAMISYFPDGHHLKSNALDSTINHHLQHLVAGHDKLLVGDFKHRGHDQILAIDQSSSVRLFDFAPTPGVVSLNDSAVNAETAIRAQDVLLVGDFKNVGHAQLLSIDQAISQHSTLIVRDFKTDQQLSFPFPLGTMDQQAGFTIDQDDVRVGDFLCVGYDQILFVNRQGATPRIFIVDLAGAVPRIVYTSDAEVNKVLEEFLETDDLLLTGRFVGSQCADILFIKNQPPGNRILIAEFSGTPSPSFHLVYQEAWDASYTLNRWQYAASRFVGRFLGGATDQILFVDRTDG